MEITFKSFRKYLFDGISRNEHEISSLIGEGFSISKLTISLVRETQDNILISITGFENITSLNNITKLKRIILEIIENYPIVVKRVKGNENELRVNLVKNDEITEAVIKVFKRKGNSLALTLKCIGGPKNNKRVSDPSICMQPPSFNRRVGSKKGSRNKNSRAKRRARTKVTNIISRKRLQKANKRIKKARGF